MVWDGTFRPKPMDSHGHMHILPQHNDRVISLAYNRPQIAPSAGDSSSPCTPAITIEPVMLSLPGCLSMSVGNECAGIYSEGRSLFGPVHVVMQV